MRFASLCSGIETASLAWPFWECAFVSEIEKFPSAVISHHYPEYNNIGDMINIFRESHHARDIDLIGAGTPCQDFSIAGKQGGLAGSRGYLSWIFAEILGKFLPRWFVLENVPNLFTTNQGRDFGALIGRMAELGYRLAWRVLDAQYFGVPQQRRRIVVVGYLGDRDCARAVLFEPETLRGRPKKAKKARAQDPLFLADRPGGDCRPVVFDWQSGGKSMRLNLSADLISTIQASQSPAVVLTHQVSPCIQERDGKGADSDFTKPAIMTVSCGDRGLNAEQVAGGFLQVELAPEMPGTATITLEDGRVLSVRIRKLTPLELERAMGLPDNYTRIPWRDRPAELCPDGPRLRAIGNAWVPQVFEWVGKRISKVNEIVHGYA